MNRIEQAKRKITQWWNTPVLGIRPISWRGNIYHLRSLLDLNDLAPSSLAQALGELHAEVRLRVEMRCNHFAVFLSRYPDRQQVIDQCKANLLQWWPSIPAAHWRDSASALRRLAVPNVGDTHGCFNDVLDALEQLSAEGKIIFSYGQVHSENPWLTSFLLSEPQHGTRVWKRAVSRIVDPAQDVAMRRYLRRWIRKFFDTHPGKAWMGSLSYFCNSLTETFPKVLFNAERVWDCLRQVNDGEIVVDQYDDKMIAIRSRTRACTGVLRSTGVSVNARLPMMDVQDKNVLLGRKDIHDRAARVGQLLCDPLDLRDKVFKCRIQDLLQLLQQVSPSSTFKAERVLTDGDGKELKYAPVVRLSMLNHGKEIPLRDIPEEVPKAEACE